MEKVKWNKELIFKIFFIIFVFMFCFIWSMSQPYDSAPDEYMKYDVCKYIANNGSLPLGGDESIRNPIWGISYAFQPIFSYIISAIFMKIVMAITKLTVDDFAVFVAARFVSVLSCTGTVIFIMKIAKKLFEDKKYQWMFIVFASLLPQYVFIGSYLNNDSFAIFTISIIIYSWIIGLENKWDTKSCISLALGIGFCALSYYNAYVYILCSIIMFISSFINIKEKKFNYKDMLKKGILITIIVFAICGWFFIRNAVLYNGDFLGLRTESEYAEKYAMDQYKPSNSVAPIAVGNSLKCMLIDMKWLSMTFKSFVATFGYMSILGPWYLYRFFEIVIVLAVIGCIIDFKEIFWNKDKSKRKLHYFFIVAMILSVILSVGYSYMSDFQPQGRYIMPSVIPFMYFLISGLKKLIEFIKFKYIKIGIILVFCLMWATMSVMCLTNIIIPIYR